MNNETLLVALSNQKGGVGKSAFTVLLASYYHYVKSLNVAVIDCDSPQHSLSRMRERDMQAIGRSDYFKQQIVAQFERIQKKVYPIVNSTAAPPSDEELYEDAEQTPLDTEFSRGLTYDEISNAVGVLTTAAPDADNALAAARTIFNLKNTELFEFFTTQVSNTAAVERLLAECLDHTTAFIDSEIYGGFSVGKICLRCH